MRDNETRLKCDRKWTGGVKRRKGGGVFTSSEIIRAGHGDDGVPTNLTGYGVDM